jgi:hypothetical protein
MIDAWIAAGHPAGREYFDGAVCPVSAEIERGQRRYHSARCEGDLYRWSLASRGREDVLVQGVLARADAPLAMATFYHEKNAAGFATFRSELSRCPSAREQ